LLEAQYYCAAAPLTVILSAFMGDGVKQSQHMTPYSAQNALHALKCVFGNIHFFNPHHLDLMFHSQVITQFFITPACKKSRDTGNRHSGSFEVFPRDDVQQFRDLSAFLCCFAGIVFFLLV
jgi:hypothetical protein